MIDNHDEIGILLGSIRLLTHNHKLPQGACKHYRTLYQGLADFEEDFLCHVRLENNILSPRPLALAAGESDRDSSHSSAPTRPAAWMQVQR